MPSWRSRINCVANGKISELNEVKILDTTSFSDACSLGAALAFGYLNCKLNEMSRIQWKGLI